MKKKPQAIKPCPFCKAKIYGVAHTDCDGRETFQVWCWNCASTTGCYPNRESAITHWNKAKR